MSTTNRLKRKTELAELNAITDELQAIENRLVKFKKATSTITRADIKSRVHSITNALALVNFQLVDTAQSISFKSGRQAHKKVQKS